MKQNLMNRLDKIRQSEKDGKPRKERVYHTAFDLFVELIMEQHFAVDLCVCMHGCVALSVLLQRFFVGIQGLSWAEEIEGSDSRCRHRATVCLWQKKKKCAPN